MFSVQEIDQRDTTAVTKALVGHGDLHDRYVQMRYVVLVGVKTNTTIPLLSYTAVKYSVSIWQIGLLGLISPRSCYKRSSRNRRTSDTPVDDMRWGKITAPETAGYLWVGHHQPNAIFTVQ